jgi:hypothetical protein
MTWSLCLRCALFAAYSVGDGATGFIAQHACRGNLYECFCSAIVSIACATPASLADAALAHAPGSAGALLCFGGRFLGDPVAYGRRLVRLWSGTLQRWSNPLLCVFVDLLATGVCYGVWKIRGLRKIEAAEEPA